MAQNRRCTWIFHG